MNDSGTTPRGESTTNMNDGGIKIGAYFIFLGIKEDIPNNLCVMPISACQVLLPYCDSIADSIKSCYPNATLRHTFDL